MPQIIDVPGLGEVEFPDGMSDDQIASAIKANMPKAAPEQSLFQKVIGDSAQWTSPDAWKRSLGLAARVPADAVAALPLAAADAGVATRNLLTGQSNPLASQMFKEAMGQVAPTPQGGIEKGMNIAGQIALGGKLPVPQGMGSLAAPRTANLAPTAFDPKAMRTLALEKANDAGLVVPPSTTNPTLLNKFLESWGGKIATAQDASLRNQPKIDSLVKRDIGLNAADDVAEGTLPAIRQEAAAAGYTPVKGVGTIRLDEKYAKALDEIAAPYAKSEAAFPGLNKTDVVSTAASLKQKAVNSDTAIDSIQIIRDKAEAAFSSGDSATGKAYKAMAKALEDAVERSLSRRGEDAQKMLADFRNARQLIAKTHSAQKALNPELGNFDARKFAQMLNQGKPLSGGMKKAGQASQAFKEATKLSTDSGSVRNLDTVFGAAGAIATGNPWPLIYPFTRMAARDFMLSQLGQKLLAKPGTGQGLPPEVVMGGTVGLLGSQ
jgi:hypothetical protein